MQFMIAWFAGILEIVLPGRHPISRERDPVVSATRSQQDQIFPSR